MLKESQGAWSRSSRLLEQTNSQPREQASILENQRDELQQAWQLALTERAAELGRLNQYKSEFVNMSHELAHRLNSSLILGAQAVSLSNKPGTLNEDR